MCMYNVRKNRSASSVSDIKSWSCVVVAARESERERERERGGGGG